MGEKRTGGSWRSCMRIFVIAAALGTVLCSAEERIDFAKDVEPIFASRCHGCHGSKLHLGEFRLDRKADALRGGGSGVPAIVPGKSAESLLVRYVAGLDAKTVMPPSGPRLTPEQISVLRRWIDEGASWPERESTSTTQEKTTTDHWAFLPRTRPSPPPVKNKAWVRNPIDSFVLAKLEGKGWTPSPPARAEPSAAAIPSGSNWASTDD